MVPSGNISPTSPSNNKVQYNEYKHRHTSTETLTHRQYGTKLHLNLRIPLRKNVIAGSSGESLLRHPP